jgi:DNA repair exonuclease SbcCD ATPase subunit
MAQGSQSPEEARVQEIAAEIDSLMKTLAARTEEYPAFIAELQDGLVTIEQADERVDQLIAELKSATDGMEDGTALDNAIDDYKTATSDLIAEATASNNTAIKSAIPALEETLAGLEEDDASRAATVIKARNLIRTLETDKEAISFFIRANQVQRAAALISANIDEFEEIVANGQELATKLMGSINP